jgi:predicted tellurium resistance membrane protein TerC
MFPIQSGVSGVDVMLAATDLFTIENLIAFFTLTALELILGIDNVVFLAILTDRLPAHQQKLGRRVGLLGAMLMRIVLLFAISWILGLEKSLFTVFGHEISGRDLILLLGGLFLIGKATIEIHEKLELAEEGKVFPDPNEAKSGTAKFVPVIIQVMVLDMVFSIDSVITAVGMAKHIEVMIAAVVVAIAGMMVFAEYVSKFVSNNPTLKMLALSFLLLIGVMLVAESFGVHIEKGYIYFAMGFSLVVSLLNLKIIKGMRLRRALKQ